MIGIDIVEVARISKSVASDSFVRSVFTDMEYRYFVDNAKGIETLAGIFAAKEALFKALGTGINRNLRDVEVAHNDNGQPYYVINDKIPNINVGSISLSITHTKDLAIAVCVIA